MIRALVFVLIVAGCTNASERSRAAADWRANRDSVMSGEVVEALRSSASPGRIIYDPPPNLSYDSMRTTRPDLLSAADRPKR